MRTEDGCIIHRCLNGERGAFGLLVDKYKEGIYAFAYDRIGSFQDAQDVTQEVFIQAYRDLHSLRRWESFVFWLYRIASTRCKLWIRTQSRRIDRDFIEDQDPRILSDSSMDSYRDSQITESLREALDLLSENYRAVLMLHYFGGMNSNEIAKALGTSPSTIRKRLSRARAQLREEMVTTMGTVFEEQRLPSGFTFRIVEAVKRIKINPIPRMAGLPWGMSLAAGIIVAILSVGTHINLTSTESYTSISSLSGESMVQEVGEFPVDVMKMSDMTITSDQHLPGNGLGNVVPDIENALFMAPQAEGGTWARKADMPTARQFLSTSEVNGKIYAIGGWIKKQNEMLYTHAVEEYDPVTNKWTRKANLPSPKGNFSTSVVDGKIYAIGGDDSPDWTSPLVEEYDPITDKWTRKADMPTARSYLSTCAVNDKIYAIGGYKRDHLNGDIVFFSTVEEYDPKTDTWTKKTDMPTKRALGPSSASLVDGQIYVIGGTIGDDSGFDGLSSVEQYDPIADKWTQKANMPTARVASTAAVNGRIYAIGGNEGKMDQALATVEEYDPITDSWTKKNDMPTARSDLSTCAVNGRIYAIGGNMGGFGVFQELIPTSIVEVYDPNSTGESITPEGKLPTTWGEVRTASSK